MSNMIYGMKFFPQSQCICTIEDGLCIGCEKKPDECTTQNCDCCEEGQM